MNEKDKYEMMYRDCPRYGKDWERAGRVHKLLIDRCLPRDEGVWDFGAGNGSCVDWLNSSGRHAVGIELASNAVGKHRSVRQGDLREPGLGLYPRSNGVCVDVMEHIPTDDVHPVLRNIADAVTNKVYFHIALGPDKDGEDLGVELHLTQKPASWWSHVLGMYFESVVVVNERAGRFVAFVCSKV